MAIFGDEWSIENSIKDKRALLNVALDYMHGIWIEYNRL